MSLARHPDLLACHLLDREMAVENPAAGSCLATAKPKAPVLEGLLPDPGCARPACWPLHQFDMDVAGAAGDPGAADRPGAHALFAGHETTGNALTRILLSLPQHPAVLQKLRDEQAALVARHGSQITGADLQQPVLGSLEPLSGSTCP